MENTENFVDDQEIQEMPGAIQIVEGTEDGEQILEITEPELLTVSPSPSTSPVIVVTEDYRETFDTPIEDMQPITLLLVFLIFLLTLLYMIKGVDYGDFS